MLRCRLGRLRSLSGKQVIAILSRYGFQVVRQRGSHAVLQKQLANTTVTVPVPLHNELKIGTLQSIIRQSGVPKSEFEI
ncbi:type II toxin-antitoxin system HicA family toxin [Candidatus Viridilinea mediisalina]|uniref:type II toxin-antitoxin system HicA family toxin n=1 Tax=Candidatus Viridilinea mediisalina TaxID=2024553 RepID=UPI0034DEB078